MFIFYIAIPWLLSLQGSKLGFGDLGNISLCLAFLFCIRFWSEKLFVSRVTFNQIYFVISQSLVETNGQAVNHKETRAVSNGVELLKNSLFYFFIQLTFYEIFSSLPPCGASRALDFEMLVCKDFFFSFLDCYDSRVLWTSCKWNTWTPWTP